jgi:hypothetical protein
MDLPVFPDTGPVTVEMNTMARFRKPYPAKLYRKMLKLAPVQRSPIVRLVARMLLLFLTLAAIGGNASGGEVGEMVYTTAPTP